MFGDFSNPMIMIRVSLLKVIQQNDSFKFGGMAIYSSFTNVSRVVFLINLRSGSSHCLRSQDFGILLMILMNNLEKYVVSVKLCQSYARLRLTIKSQYFSNNTANKEFAYH